MSPRRLSIVQYITDYRRILTTKSDPVEKFTDELRYLVEDMKYTCLYAGGLGLAAPQVGHNLQIMVLSGKPFNQEGMICLINPEMEVVGNKSIQSQEYCLSFPRIAKIITRPAEVKVSGYVNGLTEKVTLVGKELGARLICHETDHLKGVTLAQR